MAWEMSSNAQEVAVQLGTAGTVMVAKAASVTRHYGALLVTRVQANASSGTHAPGEPHIPGTGPGPNVGSGDYRRTWHPQFGFDNGYDPWAEASTNAPQARRLEFGFVGTDAKGRLYMGPQLPYPHALPALDWIGPKYVTALEAVVDTL